MPGAQGHLETLMDSSKGPAGDKAQHFGSAQALPEAPALPCTPTVGSAHLWPTQEGQAGTCYRGAVGSMGECESG